MPSIITPAQILSIAFQDDPNFDPAKINTNVITACLYDYFRTALGHAYYNELLTQVAGNSLTAPNQYIVTNYLQPALAYYVRSRVQLNVAYKTTNTGIVSNTTDYSTTVSSNAVGMIQADSIAMGDSFKNQMLEFMTDSIPPYTPADYPTFTNSQTAPDPRQVVVDGGIVISDRTNYRQRRNGFTEDDGDIHQDSCTPGWQ